MPLLIAACSSQESFSLFGALPEEVELIAAIFFDEDSEFTGATGLEQRSQSAARLSAKVERSPGTVVAVGYQRAQLPAELSAELLLESPLRPASLDEAILPKPLWTGETALLGERGELLSSERSLELTADWMGPCARLINERAPVIDSCFPIPCGFYAEQAGCSLRLNDTRCAAESLRGEVGPRGTVRYEGSSALGFCEAVDPQVGGAHALQCTGGMFQSEVCRFELLTPGREASLFAARTELMDVDFERPASTSAARYIAGIAALEAQIVAAVFEGRSGDSCSNVSSRLVFIDPVSLERSERAAPRPCITKVGSESNRLFAVAGGTSPSLLELDLQGQIVLERPIPIQMGEIVRDMAISRIESQIVLLLRSFSPLDSRVLRFDLQSLNLIDAPEVSLGQGPSSITALQRGGFAVSDDDDELIYILQEEVVSISPRPGCGKVRPKRVKEDPSSGMLLASSRGDTQAMLVVDPQGQSLCRRVKFYEALAEPLAHTTWPEQPGLVAVGLDDDGGRARVGLLDLNQGRFLQGSVEIGRGPVDRMITAHGAAWASLAWEAALVRLRPDELR